MSDTVEVYKALDALKKKERRDRLDHAEDAIPRLRSLGERHNLQITTPGDAHWVIRKAGKAVLQYWPSAGKAQILKTGKRRRMSITDIEDWIVRGKI